jgi:RimJ/RimL family protein N-acetyltransferase/acyl carrier protein
MSKLINKDVFCDRFDNLNPGDSVPKEKINSLESEVFFEPLSIAGLEEMHRYSVDERLYEFLEIPPFKDISETKQYIEKLLDRMSGTREEKSAMYWFVRKKSNRQLIGTAGLVNLNYARKSIEWGYGVDPELWGYGYILQIQELLKHYVFEVLELNRLDGVTMISNERTIASLLAAGMKHEGTLRQYFFKEGVFIDGWKYAILAEEYFKKNDAESTGSVNTYTTEDVISIIASVLEGENIDADATMYNTSNWDSLNHMAIMVAIFEKTKINLSPIQISNATSVESITSLLNGKSNTVTT